MIKTALVTATTTATALAHSDSDGQRGQGWALKNTGPTNSVFLGGPDVTTSGATQGWEISPGQSLTFDSASVGDIPYVRTATGTTTVQVFRTGA